MIDAKTFGQELAEIVKGQLAPILNRMEALEKRFDALPTPRDGKDADLGEVRQIIAEEVSGLRTAIETIELPALPDIPAIVSEEVQKAVAAIPAPQDGKSVTAEDVAPLIASEVEKRIKELPVPKDGEPGKDGVGLAGAIIDRAGELVVTLTNGETRNLGPVVGRDGAPGKDGADGFGFDDLEATYDGEKTVTLKFAQGDRVKEFPFTLPVVIDRGIFSEGKNYAAGDGVTWGGSFWIAQKDTATKPGEGGDWRLAVKKGRDGRDGVMKEAKPKEPVRIGVPVKGA
ncbi:MAG TPA: hypothetical protein VEZ24_09285 [Microvirga sp.]|nr:hypothetical protein [Microvirga sp.]